MRKLGWVEIDMVEISHKRIQVYREKLGLDIVSERGMQQAPKDVAEAIAKLKEIEVKAAEHNAKMLAATKGQKIDDNEDEDVDTDVKLDSTTPKTARNGTAQIVEEKTPSTAKLFMQGQLVTRPETEIKAHTSYLVFAVLPREWSEEDEAAAAANWPTGKEQKVIGAMNRAARKQQKREMMHTKIKKGGQHVPRGSQKSQSKQPQPAKSGGDEETKKSQDTVMEDVQGENA